MYLNWPEQSSCYPTARNAHGRVNRAAGLHYSNEIIRIDNRKEDGRQRRHCLCPIIHRLLFQRIQTITSTRPVFLTSLYYNLIVFNRSTVIIIYVRIVRN